MSLHATLADRAIEIVDVFAEGPLTGNPLAVITVDEMPPADIRQAVARETNLAETTFVRHAPDADGNWTVRIHTPAEELPFAGHPVLGTAWVVRERLAQAPVDTVRLGTGRGMIPVAFEGSGPGARAWFVAPEVRMESIDDAGPWLEATMLGAEDLDDEALAPALIDIGPRFGVLRIRSRDRLAALAPVGAALQTLLGLHRATGVLVVAPAAEGEGDLAVRMFFDAAGVREDPATGSANAGLAALLRARGHSGRVEVTQGVEMQRRSRLTLEITADAIRVGGAVWPVYGGRFSG